MNKYIFWISSGGIRCFPHVHGAYMFAMPLVMPPHAQIGERAKFGRSFLNFWLSLQFTRTNSDMFARGQNLHDASI